MIQIKKTILTLVALLALTTGAWAQTEVSTFTGLQTALTDGNDVKLTANIQFTSSITISGTKKITIDGNGKTLSGPSTRAFSIYSGNTLVINNATLDNFDLNKGGGAILNSGTLVLDGCTVSNNHTDGNGQGGGAIENQGTLYASNTTFSGNYSSEIGGAINNYGGNLYLSGCTFTNNYTTSSNANYGGAIGNNSNNTFVLVNCTFSGNKYGGSNGTAGDLGFFSSPGTYTIAGCTGIAMDGATLTTYQYGTATLDYSDLSAISFTYDQSDTPIAVASTVTVDWNKTSKTGTFTQPAGNVTVSVEYFPQAALTAVPTAINDVPATTDGDIVKAGTVANIGSTETAQGTVMYYVSTTALDDDALLDLAADAWKADVPTAKSLAQGQAYVYYYVRGKDSDNDEENFSDGDILAANALNVTIAAEPTYAVSLNKTDLAEGEPALWKAKSTNVAEVNLGEANLKGVKKSETVTVTYTGTKKVIGVKAEKKSAADPTVTLTPGEIGDLTSGGSSSKAINGITIAVSGDAHFNTAGLMQVSANDPETGEPISGAGTFTFTSSVGKIKRIDINHNSGRWWGSGAGWPDSYNVSGDNNTFTWSGTPAASVTLNGSCNDEENCHLYSVSSFVFTLEPTN